MNVSLTPELEKMIEKKVKSGRYNTASEVVREGLRLLEEQDVIRRVRLEALRRDIIEGAKAVKRGDFVSLESADDYKRAAEKIKAKGRKRLANKVSR